MLCAQFLKVNKHINSQSDTYSNGSGSPAPSFAPSTLPNVSEQTTAHAHSGAAAALSSTAARRNGESLPRTVTLAPRRCPLYPTPPQPKPFILRGFLQSV